MKTFILTCGDINGIGPEICLKTVEHFNDKSSDRFVIIIPQNIFDEIYSKLNLTFPYSKISHKDELKKIEDQNIVYCLPPAQQNYGKPTFLSGKISYKALLKSRELLGLIRNSALITAPISKEAFHKAKINYPGHTEMLAEWFGIKKFSMMFLSNKMKCGLLTIHQPIRKIPAQITFTKLREHTSTIISSLRNDFGFTEPSIAVLGLNPHSGENGQIGKEEKEIISPFLMNSRNLNLFGPFVPDAFFANHYYKHYDCVIGMYHDQVLIPFKMLSFDRGVNFTAGLPIVRTSPDHGTAFDIAGQFRANPRSMIEACKWAKIILTNRGKKK